MIKKIPIVAASLGYSDIFFASKGFFSGNNSRQELKERFSFEYPNSQVFLFNSGTACLFVLLERLKKTSDKTEVIISSYTAAGVLNAVRKAGLKPILCDINLKDFNLDAGYLKGLVTDKTLAIVAAHLFGIPDQEALGLKQKYPGVFIIEDCAQAQGSKISGKNVGAFSDAAIFSFNRGKNLPAYGGGALVINVQEFGKVDIEEGFPEQTVFDSLKIAGKAKALVLAMNPYIYGLLYPLIARFKEQPAASDFIVKRYTDFQAALALELFKKIESESKLRFQNGLSLIEELKHFKSLNFPDISKDLFPAFNRLPVLVNDARQRDRLSAVLWKEGFETSRMYYKPLHHMYDLGYKREGFPNSCYFADSLLTLPVHPLMRDKDITRLIKVVKRCL